MNEWMGYTTTITTAVKSSRLVLFYTSINAYSRGYVISPSISICFPFQLSVCLGVRGSYIWCPDGSPSFHPGRRLVPSLLGVWEDADPGVDRRVLRPFGKMAVLFQSVRSIGGKLNSNRGCGVTVFSRWMLTSNWGKFRFTVYFWLVRRFGVPKDFEWISIILMESS